MSQCNCSNSRDDFCIIIRKPFGLHNVYQSSPITLMRLILIQAWFIFLLQRFIGSSQKGMSSLEKRVDGLERVLDEMSHDFAISTRRISGTDSGGNTCCMIPGAEFLSPKFWRKGDGQTVNTKFPASFRSQSFRTSAEISRIDSPRNC